MFRKLRRFKQEMTADECRELLNTAKRGTLSLHGDNGYPYGIPINFVFINDKLYFHTALEGHKVDALNRDNKVSFCVIDEGVKHGDDWPLHFKSVIVFGRMNRVTDESEVIDILRKLGGRYYPTPESVEHEITKAVSRVAVWELDIDYMSGKRVKES